MHAWHVNRNARIGQQASLVKGRAQMKVRDKESKLGLKGFSVLGQGKSHSEKPAGALLLMALCAKMYRWHFFLGSSVRE